ncbi:MAG TPA: DUF47 family protein [Rhizomicrobium sp.]|nr:DUF47 family protein [Rhizomicrobium sp.]
MAVAKTRIVGELGGSALLLPQHIADGLAANARIKFALSWLQAAETMALKGGVFPAAELEPERSFAGLKDDLLFAPAETALPRAQGMEVPRANAIVARLRDELARMFAAVEAGAAAGLLPPALVEQFRQRRDALLHAATIDGDILPSGFVSWLSRPPREGRDSFHGLVMDMHKALNTVSANVAEDDVAGARVFRLRDDDKARVGAFMRGLNRTAPLKFDHPGLATNAMRSDGRLIIQNDIGTTDAHVLLASVEGLRLSVTHSDIHAPRLDFFLRRNRDIAWTISNRQAAGFEEEIFYVATGTIEARDTEALDRTLEQLGASLVFLIDWNKARKSLRRLVPKADATAILDWAADHEVGHRAYLQAGGDALIVDLLETVSKATGGFYVSLQGAVGEEGAITFLHDALRVSCDDLKNARSAVAVRDHLRAELLARVASIGDRIAEIALDHAALTLDLANLARRALLSDGAAESTVARAKAWELLADRQVTRIRELCGTGKERAWREIASVADDAADNLEETVFRLQFLTGGLPKNVRDDLLRLSEHTVAAVREYVRLLSALRNVHRATARQEMRNFLDLVEKVHEEEHASDDAERSVFAGLMRADVDAKTLSLAASVAGSLEDAGDALLRTARLLSDHVLGEWFAV